ncbi:hypothetical protein K470DRAFT_219433 [Piedraia hortae CBS 480.64]|uniref:EF-hand domain-containing protein n=1 Tax=Piedraia hortae CBS 480.64 TaxID=1314780 RepID=A0A6A7BXP2_9PEZI|nr:hypothetical protein K470DRAFT_219433 [Piedraia hortae CBS 480.64]
MHTLATLLFLLTTHAAAANWAERHMSEEHHIDAFDAASFFIMHDFSNNNEWGRDDILKMYGLKDASTNHITKVQKESAVDRVISLYDRDRSGTISFAEYTVGAAQGIELPDFGFGSGHHGDDEYEYEIHHFEKYHNEDAREEDLTHEEDKKHFKQHDEIERQAERQSQLEKLPIIESNIPSKFRRT